MTNKELWSLLAAERAAREMAERERDVALGQVAALGKLASAARSGEDIDDYEPELADLRAAVAAIGSQMSLRCLLGIHSWRMFYRPPFLQPRSKTCTRCGKVQVLYVWF
jgi:hypothetical protein